MGLSARADRRVDFVAKSNGINCETKLIDFSATLRYAYQHINTSTDVTVWSTRSSILMLVLTRGEICTRTELRVAQRGAC
eukprot:140179-Rhodomonas_salina.3